MYSDEEFECLQISKMDYNNTQSSGFGCDIVDENKVVSLENDVDLHSNYGRESTERVLKAGESFMYGNIIIENISSDEEIDCM